MNMFGHYESVARRKLSATDNDEFVFHTIESLDDHVTKLTGCTSSGLVTKGPRKGRPRFDGMPQTAYVTSSEYAAERARFEADTNQCAECMGSAKVMASWDNITGTTYMPCRACAGTGRPQTTDSKGAA